MIASKANEQLVVFLANVLGILLGVDGADLLLIAGKTQLHLMSTRPISGRSYPRPRFNRALIQILPIICTNTAVTEQTEAIVMALIRRICMTDLDRNIEQALNKRLEHEGSYGYREISSKHPAIIYINKTVDGDRALHDAYMTRHKELEKIKRTAAKAAAATAATATAAAAAPKASAANATAATATAAAAAPKASAANATAAPKAASTKAGENSDSDSDEEEDEYHPDDRLSLTDGSSPNHVDTAGFHPFSVFILQHFGPEIFLQLCVRETGHGLYTLLCTFSADIVTTETGGFYQHSIYDARDRSTSRALCERVKRELLSACGLQRNSLLPGSGVVLCGHDGTPISGCHGKKDVHLLLMGAEDHARRVTANFTYEMFHHNAVNRMRSVGPLK